MLAAPQQMGDGEGGHRRDEHHGDAREDPRQGQGQGHTAEHRDRIGPQVPGGLDQPVVQLDDDRVDGQDHEGQEVVHHAQHHRALGVDHFEILDLRAKEAVDEVEQADSVKKTVEQAGVLQDGHPGVGAQQEIHPHGQHDEHHGHPLEAGSLPGQETGNGVAHQQADHGGDEGQLEGPGEDHRVVPDAGEVVQGEAASGGRKGIDHHHQNGDDHKDGHPDHIGDGKQGELIPLHLRPPPPLPPRGHRRRR